MQRSTYVVAVGSNRWGRHGRPEAEVTGALAAIPGDVLAAPIITSAPLGPSTRRFANTVALVQTDVDPETMLHRLKRIECSLGRRDGLRWGARVIDLDIVLWTGGAYSVPGLEIPHPAFRGRDFVLAPLCVIAPDWRDPLTGLTMRQLRARLTSRRPLPRRSRTGEGP
ncbi:2-amino-4-hydroxy-6-hydroxymethyldihydropteridine diphosphokinase [Sphingomonas radiodurans]|uniref:2-amino-4-hydroxy-6- hydroxymethyldihydropteridine diphosphokinase n=1 Tax=Sphingomonas radiodurans TaxID=2890321 RepID=UPI001E5A8169|nr:2-amino-4-hydroxy-6-hydroxymethyldihydropteridine diphosphokinase [Sphingomonas radiodurans]WBH17029.1 2-amino-4-hydroxy-6-hydroxymethyldihydropteridine diphosphokinase [Sphingomonas radiodurans]